MQRFYSNEEWLIDGEDGWQNFSGVREIIGKFECIKVIVNNGYWIKGTPEHVVYIEYDKEIELRELKVGMRIKTLYGYEEVVGIEVSREEVVYDVVGTRLGRYVTNGVVTKNCDEFAHVPNGQCVMGDEVVEVRYGDEVKKVTLEKLYNVMEVVNGSGKVCE